MKDTRLTNASGTTFDMNIDRTVSLMDAGEVAADFNIQLTNDMKIVAYKSENKITNTVTRHGQKRVVLYLCGCSAVLILHRPLLYSFLISKMRKEQL